MDKINFNLDLEHLKKYQNEEYQKLINNKKSLAKIQQLGLTEQQVKSNINIFKKHYDSIRKCIDCKSIDQCKQQIQGYFIDIANDDYLVNVYKKCPYFEQKAQKNKHLENYTFNSMPVGLRNIFISKLENKGSQQYIKILMHLKQLIENESFEGVYLVGDVGVGKTYLAAAACNEMALKGKTTAFVYLSDYVRLILSLINSGTDITSRIESLMKVDFLVIDDIGAERMTEFVRDELLMPILNYRMENQLTTWFTSNESQESLGLRYKAIGKNRDDFIKSERLMERIIVLSKQIVLTGVNRRRTKNESSNKV